MYIVSSDADCITMRHKAIFNVVEQRVYQIKYNTIEKQNSIFTSIKDKDAE